MRPGVLAGVVLAFGFGACATPHDVMREREALAHRVDAAQHAFCPPRELAFAAAELAFAQAASDRADPGAAARHLSLAHDWAQQAEAQSCATAPDAAAPPSPGRPSNPIPPSTPNPIPSPAPPTAPGVTP